jgi:L-ascorbate oxidase
MSKTHPWAVPMTDRIRAMAALLVVAAGSTSALAREGTDASNVPPPLFRQLEVAMVRGTMWNPWTLKDDPVELRFYRGEGMKDGDFVAPTIRVKPGQTLKVRLDNRLPSCREEDLEEGPCRNDTNLHTHGLWVSPTGNSDNVMIAIPPGGHFDYEFRIPDEHPAGTFWYHPHRHGTGMVQLGSGMAGALIVEGDRLPTTGQPGDVDILLKDARGRPFPERVLVFQNIPYACAFEQDGWPRFARDAQGKRVGPWTCEPGEIGRIERDSQFFRPPEGTRSGRFLSINGKVQPVLRNVEAGRFERWRILNAGTFGIVRLHLRQLAPRAPDLASIPATEHPKWIEQYCSGPDLPAWQLAHDGLTRSHLLKAEESVLAAGNRLDLLTWFPQPGRYCLLQLIRGPDFPTTLVPLSVLEVGGRASTADPGPELRRQLVLATQSALAGEQHAAMRSRVIADLENGLRLAAFAPHPAIGEFELSGRQSLEFRIVGEDFDRTYLTDGKTFDHARIDRFLPLGGVEEWRLSVPEKGGNHTFHIHVNPFQIVSARNTKGEDLIDPASPGFNPDYAGLAGEWLDNVTLQPGTTVVMRTRYERFIGDAMLHCHVALHSDHGMMQHVRIYLPGSSDDPGAHPPGAHH